MNLPAFTPIQVACMQGNADAVRQSISQSADVNAKSSMSGFTLLHSCVAGTDSPQRAQIIEMLHEAGAKLDVYDDEKGLTPLHYAALRDKPLCAAALIRCGASVHATEGNGATALHGAAYFGHVAVTRVLLEGGADPSRADGRGNTPLALARAEGHTEVLNLLEEAAEKKRR